jgi:hypothetical protein
VGANVQKKFSILEPLHVWCISIWIVAAIGALLVIRGDDIVADEGTTDFAHFKWYYRGNIAGVFLVNLSYISIWWFSFAYYRASTLLKLDKNFESKIELTNFLQNQDRKDKIFNISAVSSIILLSALQAICCKNANNIADWYGATHDPKELRWSKADNIFGFLLDLVAILCLALLVVALKTIYEKVKQETQMVMNP